MDPKAAIARTRKLAACRRMLLRLHRHGWSLREIAAKIGVCTQTLTRWYRMLNLKPLSNPVAGGFLSLRTRRHIGKRLRQRCRENGLPSLRDFALVGQRAKIEHRWPCCNTVKECDVLDCLANGPATTPEVVSLCGRYAESLLLDLRRRGVVEAIRRQGRAFQWRLTTKAVPYRPGKLGRVDFGKVAEGLAGMAVSDDPES